MQDLRLRPWTDKDEAELQDLQHRKDTVNTKLRDAVLAALSGLSSLSSLSSMTGEDANKLITYMIRNAKDIRDALALADDGERPPGVKE